MSKQILFFIVLALVIALFIFIFLQNRPMTEQNNTSSASSVTQGNPCLEKFGVTREGAAVEQVGNISKSSFANLSVHNATETTSTSRVVGKLLVTPSFYRDVVLFLLQSKIIETYVHAESEVCLASEKDGPNTYEANFQAKHVYFTNERFEQEYIFVISINKKTGEILLLTQFTS